MDNRLQEILESFQSGSELFFCDPLDYFKKYIEIKKASSFDIDTDFFQGFFERGLPWMICRGSQGIDDILPVLIRFCAYADHLEKTSYLESLKQVPKYILQNFTRVLHAKQEILKFLQYPVITDTPCIIDLDSYRKKAISQYDRKQIFDCGIYMVEEYFSRQSLVLKKLTGYSFYIRLYFNQTILNYVRPGDRMYLKMKRYKDSNWMLEYAGGCFLPETMPEKGCLPLKKEVNSRKNIIY